MAYTEDTVIPLLQLHMLMHRHRSGYLLTKTYTPKLFPKQYLPTIQLKKGLIVLTSPSSHSWSSLMSPFFQLNFIVV